MRSSKALFQVFHTGTGTMNVDYQTCRLLNQSYDTVLTAANVRGKALFQVFHNCMGTMDEDYKTILRYTSCLGQYAEKGIVPSIPYYE